MEQSPIETELTYLLVDFLVFAIDVLVVLLVLSVIAYLLVGVPLIVYLSNALDRRASTD